MRIILLTAAFIIQAITINAQQAIPNHLQTVKDARALYAKLPPGRLRAYCICNKVAHDLRAEGVGLFYKTGDNSFAQRSSDVLIYKPRGETFDVLGDAEKTAVPQWGRTKPTGFGPIANWRAPQDPATVTVCQTAAPIPPIPPTTPPTDLTARVVALETTVAAQGREITGLDARLTALGNRVTALEQNPPTPCTMKDVTTSTTAFHAHTVKVCQ